MGKGVNKMMSSPIQSATRKGPDQVPLFSTQASLSSVHVGSDSTGKHWKRGDRVRFMVEEIEWQVIMMSDLNLVRELKKCSH